MEEARRSGLMQLEELKLSMMGGEGKLTRSPPPAVKHKASTRKNRIKQTATAP